MAHIPQLPPAQPPGNDTLGVWLMRPIGRRGGRGGLINGMRNHREGINYFIVIDI